TFARALQNPDRYTVTSVLKWLKTAPAPNTTAKIEVVTPENAVMNGNYNGHHDDQGHDFLHTWLEEPSSKN
ncbi:MAG: hypothetical protein J2P36_21685, partial [Ktedonobacteraceae bacterium]|nr:hypothetical protein [Ktedonobacteraceae bacterium]